MEKASCHQYWKVFEAASDEQLVAFSELGKNPEIISDIVDKIEHYTCRIHQFNTKSSSLSELRWFLFTLKQVNRERLQPTRDCHTGCEKCKLPVTDMGTRWEARPGNIISSGIWLEHRGRPICSWQMRDILCTKILARIGQVLVRQKQMSAGMSMFVKKHSVHRDVCVQKWWR